MFSPAGWRRSAQFASMMKAGDHIVASNNLYGGVPRLFNQILTNFGLEFTYVDTSDAAQCRARDPQEHRYVYIETPTNPLMGLTDIAAVAHRAQNRALKWSWTTHFCRLTFSSRSSSAPTW